MAAVQPQLEEVEARIARQAAAFDPAVEAYVTYAIGSRGKRLRPLVALSQAVPPAELPPATSSWR
jgi:hypothetical protein